MSHSIKNLRDVDDMAVKHGFSDTQEARFPREDLDAESTGLALQTIRAGKHQAFAHRHEDAEEIYVVLSGSGKIKLDDEVLDLDVMDAIRIGPSVGRALEAGPEGLEILAFGPRHEDDVEMVKDFWEG
jgi:mannose-6-phosphate isomerase-like protein (cupin superfamily)